MKALIDVFRMTEVSKMTRANIIIELGQAINIEYGMSITDSLVVELVNQLVPEHRIFQEDRYLKHVNQ